MHTSAFLAPNPYAARTSFHAALIEYYKAKHDQNSDVSEMARARAACYRKYEIPDEDIGRLELSLVFVSTTNAPPTLFWNLVFIYSDPAITAAIRNELLGIVDNNQERTKEGKRRISIDITKFENHTLLLVSSYRETLPLANSQLGTRRAIENTVISAEGKSYLLRKGSDIQMPAEVTHNSPDIWGSNASSFDARRFIKTNDNNMTEIEKEQKRAYFPFGGGKHLCPGRQFAFAEILGVLYVLLLGFEVKGMDGKSIQVPYLGKAKLGEAVAKPRGKGAEMGAKITRREGWEVVWSFTASE